MLATKSPNEITKTVSAAAGAATFASSSSSDAAEAQFLRVYFGKSTTVVRALQKQTCSQNTFVVTLCISVWMGVVSRSKRRR